MTTQHSTQHSTHHSSQYTGQRSGRYRYWIRRVALACGSAIVCAVPAAAQTKRPMTFDDFAAVRVVGDPQLSPDGRRVLYSVRTTDLKANKRTTVTYVLPIGGGDPVQFPAPGSNVAEARWSPDGTHIAYTSGGQLWIADASGANARQLTRLTGGASGPVWAPTGDRIAFTSSVRPNCSTVECAPVRPDSGSSGMVYSHLLFRHWTAYDDGTRSHLFVVAPDGSGIANVTDVTKDAPYDVPPGPFGGSEGYAFAPDGKELAFSAKDQGVANAWSTDVNLYVVPVSGGAPMVITRDNRGADENPVYSPDGRSILYQSQATASFESDQWRLMSYDRGTHQSTRVVPAWDRNADVYTYAPDGSAIYVQTTDASRDKIYRIARSSGGWDRIPRLVISGHNNTALSIAHDGRTVVWSRDAINAPAELYSAVVAVGGVTGERQITHENDALIAQLALNPAEDFWYRGALGDSVQGMIIRPPQYQPGKKLPVLLVIHGGPQSPFLDSWHPRWNFSLLASPGFAIVFVNPHGSPGYGQKFVNAVSHDWAGAPYQDIMKGLDAALARNMWMDSTRMGAAGASYGGYMVNWIAGHNARFRALFTHDGVWNLEAMAGGTEELWFTEHEFDGEYWNRQAMQSQYRIWSPHLSAGNLRTPHLVVHSELDYRIPISEGIALFTALQRQGVPSKFIVFPDEGHFIGKPDNQRLWYHEVLGWFDHYLNH